MRALMEGIFMDINGNYRYELSNIQFKIVSGLILVRKL